MVRRWSYLNKINLQSVFINSQNSQSLKIGSFQETFLTTTYYKNSIYSPSVTKLTRKAFFRRRHLNTWLTYQVILTMWAKEYLFFRRYMRFLNSLYFYKNNYLTYNLFVFQNTPVSDVRSLENTFLTSLVSQIWKYLNKTTKNFMFFKSKVQNFLPILVSTPDLKLIENVQSKLLNSLVYNVSQKSLVYQSKGVLEASIIPYILNLPSSLYLKSLNSVYKMLVILYFIKL